MKKIISIILITIMLFSLSACKNEQPPEVTQSSVKGLSSKFENSLELQKSIFIGKIKSSSQTKALIPKYNLDITNYTVYNVEITESLDGYTPTGEVTVMSVGSSAEFLARLSLSTNETYILEAEPWIYDGEMVYLLSLYTTAYPKIDSADRVTLSESGKKTIDYGTKQEYAQTLNDAKQAFERKNEGFFEPKKVLERYEQIFANVRNTNAKEWLREEFEYKWQPNMTLIAKTRTASEKVYNHVLSLKEKTDLTTEDIQSIFKVI